MHAYAAQSPVFDAMAAKAFRDTSGEVGTFCTGCHSPVGVAQGESGAMGASERAELSKESVGCDVCHSATTHATPVGNLSLYFRSDGVKNGPYGSTAVEGHASEKSDFLQSPELCGSCHDVFNFPAIRIEEAYTEYSSSPAAEAGVTCQDCHMSSDPGAPAAREIGPAAVVEGRTYPDRELSSHRFVGPDYSLLDRFPYSDAEESAEAQAEYLLQVQRLLENAARISDVRLSLDGGSGEVEVDVESLVTGHNVPTGFTSERQLWVDIRVVDESGQVLLRSGDLDSYGDLRDSHSWDVLSGAEALDSQLVNFQSKNLHRHGNVDEYYVEETVFPFDADYIHKDSLAPLEKRTLRYGFERGGGGPSGGRLDVEVSLKYRNLPPYLLRALQVGELVDRLQVFTVSSYRLEDG